MYTQADVQNFARKFIQDMIDSSIDLSADEDYNIPSGDITEEIRGQAMGYAEDMLFDFSHEVLRAIREMKFTAERTIVVNFKD
jgi:hypothetical protein